MLQTSFRNELVYEGQVTQRQRAKGADGINSVTVAQAMGQLGVSFYFSPSNKEQQALFELMPEEGQFVRIKARIKVGQKVGKGDRVTNPLSTSVYAVEPMDANGGTRSASTDDALGRFKKAA